MIFVASQ
ncbi:hypothetical protein D046_3200, partial [Vibrio parahaemolyticus V-223/04]